MSSYYSYQQHKPIETIQIYVDQPDCMMGAAILICLMMVEFQEVISEHGKIKIKLSDKKQCWKENRIVGYDLFFKQGNKLSK